VTAQVIPVFSTLVRGSETTGAIPLIDDGNSDASTSENAGGIKTTGTTSEDGDVLRSGHEELRRVRGLRGLARTALPY
jgi:hypothetical protein